MAIRRFGNNPTLLRFVATGFLFTALVLALLLLERSGIPDLRRMPVFYRLFVVEDFPAVFLMLAGMLCIAPWPAAQRAAAALAVQLGRRPLATAGVVFVVLCLGSVFVYHRHPLAMDEYVPWTQSRIFLAGRLAGQFPPELLDWLIPRGFQNYFFAVSRQTGEFASSYWPGLAFLFTPFMALGIPWACNPAIGAASVWVIHRLTLELSRSSEAAGTAVLFTLASAVFAVNAISFYSMPAHLLCNAAFALLLLQPTWRRALAAGFIGGLALTLHNPSRHAVFAIPWLLWLLWGWRWRAMLAISAGYLPWIIVVGFGWNHFRGLVGAAEAIAARPVASGGLADALVLMQLFDLPGPVQLEDWAISLAKAWLWATPLLLLLASLGYERHRRDVHVRLLYASLVLTILAKLLVPVNQGHGWGFRYLHGTWFVLPVLAALAMVPCREEAGDVKRMEAPVAWTRAGAFAGLLVLLPYFAWQVHAFIGAHLRQLPEARAGRPRIVLIDAGYYSADLVQNDPFLRADVIRMLSQGEQLDRRMLMQHYPDLVLLSQDERGSVWGYPGRDAAVQK